MDSSPAPRRSRSARIALAICAAALGIGGPAGTARAVTFSNSGSINFPADAPANLNDGVGPASPYPSPITVSGAFTSLTKVTVTIHGFTHGFPADVDMLLVSPSGRYTFLMSDVGGVQPVSGVNVTLDDDALQSLPGGFNPSDTLTAGTFHPTNSALNDFLEPPAPAGSFGASLATFNGEDPNGTWQLFARDDDAGETGALTGGWSIDITSESLPVGVDDAATVDEDSAVTTIPVLPNDTRPDGGLKRVVAVGPAAHGTAAVAPGGTAVTYRPDANYCNDPGPEPTDDFTYTLNGGSTADVSVTVTCEEEPPVAVDDSATVIEDAPATAIDVLANDTDPDGGAKTIVSAANPAHGTVTVSATKLTYRPDPDYCNDPGPTDDFAYTVNGGSMATVRMTVTCVDDTPPPVTGSPQPSPGGGSPLPGPVLQRLALGTPVLRFPSGVIAVPLICVAAPGAACRSDVKLAFKNRRQRLSALTFRGVSVPAGRTVDVVLRPSKAQRARLIGFRSIPITVSATNAPGTTVTKSARLRGGFKSAHQ